jgi:hypothetical protein
MLNFFRSDFGLFILLLVGFIAGLLGGTGIVLGIIVLFALFVVLGLLLVTEKKSGPASVGGRSGGSSSDEPNPKDKKEDVLAE